MYHIVCRKTLIMV